MVWNSKSILNFHSVISEFLHMPYLLPVKCVICHMKTSFSSILDLPVFYITYWTLIGGCKQFVKPFQQSRLCSGLNVLPMHLMLERVCNAFCYLDAVCTENFWPLHKTKLICLSFFKMLGPN